AKRQFVIWNQRYGTLLFFETTTFNKDSERARRDLRKNKSSLVIACRSLSKALIHLGNSYSCICDGRPMRINDVSGDRAAGRLRQNNSNAKHEDQDENRQYSYSHRFLQDAVQDKQPFVVLQTMHPTDK